MGVHGDFKHQKFKDLVGLNGKCGGLNRMFKRIFLGFKQQQWGELKYRWQFQADFHRFLYSLRIKAIEQHIKSWDQRLHEKDGQKRNALV